MEIAAGYNNVRKRRDERKWTFILVYIHGTAIGVSNFQQFVYIISKLSNMVIEEVFSEIHLFSNLVAIFACGLFYVACPTISSTLTWGV